MCLLSAICSSPMVHIHAPGPASYSFYVIALKYILVHGMTTLTPLLFFFKYDLVICQSLSF
jgi:hypothetical protein